jgi:hypothetical protein
LRPSKGQEPRKQQRARAEKTTHILEQLPEQQTQENDDDDEEEEEAIDKELEIVQQKIQLLQKEKEKFASQLQAKRKASEKLEKLNQAKEQIEAIQREIVIEGECLIFR